MGDLRSIPGLGRSPGGGHGNTLQYSCLENPNGQRSLAGYSSRGCKESDTTERLSTTQHKVSTWAMEEGRQALNNEATIITQVRRLEPRQSQRGWRRREAGRSGFTDGRIELIERVSEIDGGGPSADLPLHCGPFYQVLLISMMSEGRRRFGGEDDVFGTCETGSIYWHGQMEMHSRLLDTDLEFRGVENGDMVLVEIDLLW